MAIRAGTRLGQYEVTALIGAGGMGQVHRARDTKLKREVAIKVLPEEFAHDSERLSRLRREAQALAALSHPNIAAIYDLQEVDGSNFLVLELIEGEPLSQKLKRRPFAIGEALRTAKQIAEAIEAAIQAGTAPDRIVAVLGAAHVAAIVRVHAPGAIDVKDLGRRTRRAESSEHFRTDGHDAALGHPSPQDRMLRLLVAAVVANRRAEETRADDHFDHGGNHGVECISHPNAGITQKKGRLV